MTPDLILTTTPANRHEKLPNARISRSGFTIPDQVIYDFNFLATNRTQTGHKEAQY